MRSDDSRHRVHRHRADPRQPIHVHGDRAERVGISDPSRRRRSITTRTTSARSRWSPSRRLPRRRRSVRYVRQHRPGLVDRTGQQQLADHALHGDVQPGGRSGRQQCVFVSATSCIIRNLPTYDTDDPLDLLALVLATTRSRDGDERDGQLVTSPSLTSIFWDDHARRRRFTGRSDAGVRRSGCEPYEPPGRDDRSLDDQSCRVQIPGYVSVPDGRVRPRTTRMGSGPATARSRSAAGSSLRRSG